MDDALIGRGLAGRERHVNRDIVDLAGIQRTGGLFVFWFQAEGVVVDVVVRTGWHHRVSLVRLRDTEMRCLAALETFVAVQADNSGFQWVRERNTGFP